MVLEKFVDIWNRFLDLIDAIPEDNIAVSVYILGAVIILWCWYAVIRRIPAPFGGILWVVLFALIATPTISEGPNSEIAPAIFGLLFGILTKDSPLIWSNLSLILFVIGIGFVIGWCWSKANITMKKTKKSDDASPL
ncbi:hypothetical protein [Acinetobacter larvae]|uniref:Resolvase n=1 Tax=Acinetobacter larvae TaxID=1789224 RepID=A0A1B2M0T9_9GAMM|nr:hypothetical protein [Acinetobacter larvae]AOA58633.1 hypothetical protein BFG52_09900 [Acinetobacter larvae]